MQARTLFAISAAATGAYVLLSDRVRRGKTTWFDAKARGVTRKVSSQRAEKLAEATGHIGKWYAHVPLALAGAGMLVRGKRPAAGSLVAASSLAAASLSPVLDRVHKKRTPPPGKLRIDPLAQCYPSGHALETTAVAITSAYVLAREHLAPSAAVAPIAALASAVSGIGRLLMDRHWTTDAVAGYLAGIALGCACAGAYELARPKT